MSYNKKADGDGHVYHPVRTTRRDLMIRSPRLLSVLCLSCALLAQSPESKPTPAKAALPTGAPAGMAQITREALQAHADFLAADERGGRLTGSPGQIAAAQYIAKHFESCGLQPLGDLKAGGKHDWLQWYDLVRTSLDLQKTTLTVGTDAKRLELTQGIAVVAPRKARTVEIEGEMGWFPGGAVPEGQDLSKVIPVVVVRTPTVAGAGIEQQFGMAMMSMTRVKQIGDRLGKQGAKAAVFCILDPNSPLLNVLNYVGLQPGKDVMSPAKSTQKDLGGDQMGGLAAMMQARIPGVFVAPKQARELILALGHDPEELKAPKATDDDDAEPAAKPAPASKQAPVPGRLALAITVDDKARACNVVAVLPGSDAQLAKEAIVFSAHMDHVGLRMDGEVFNGADDNASGTAGLLGIAQAFGKGGKRPKRSVVFLAVSGEELGLWGSAFFAAHPTWPLEQIVANVNTDMIGRSGPESGPDEIGICPSHQHEQYSTIARDAAKLATHFGLGLRSGDKYYTRSDHYNFAKHDIPVVFFCDGEHEDYHMVTDHPDKLDAAKMERCARLAYWVGYQVADAKDRPVTLGRRSDWLEGSDAPAAPKTKPQKPQKPKKG